MTRQLKEQFTLIRGQTNEQQREIIKDKVEGASVAKGIKVNQTFDRIHDITTIKNVS